MAKLMNIDEEAPNKFFIFVNQLNPMTYHNLNITGRFVSGAFESISFSQENFEKFVSGKLRFLPYEPCIMDQVALSPYFLTAINDYRIEYDIEVHREKFHPLYPSRLSAIYAFKNYETCENVSKKYHWPLSEVRRFRLIEHQLNRIVKVNMEHISLARHAYKVTMLDDIFRLWEGYWQGFDNIILNLPTADFQKQDFESGVIWEYLIEGSVEKLETND